MPFFSLKKISQLAETRQAYLRGVSGYNAGWVRSCESTRNPFYPEYLTAEMEENGENCHVEVGFDEADEAEYLECSCGHFQPQEGACKHIVAALVHKYYQDMIHGLPTARQLMEPSMPTRTDDAARQLLQSCLSRESAELAADSTAAEQLVQLTPTLELHYGHPRVTFTVGSGRPYVIKNLSRFGEDMAAGATREYGKDLQLLHHPAAFTPESRPLLQFLLGEISDRQAPHGTAYAASSQRELPLTPAGFDRFFVLMEGQPLLLREDGAVHTVTALSGNPVLAVSVMKENGGLRFCSEGITHLEGIRTLYVLHHNKLYRTEAAFRRRMAEWIRTVSRAPGGLFVAVADLPAFCAGVLPMIRPYIRLDGDAQALELYQPRELEVQVYLDAPADDTVTARVLCCYGEDSVNPYAPADAPPEPWRNTLEELRARTAIQKYFTAFQPETGLLVFHGDDDRLFDFLHHGVDDIGSVATVFASDAFKKLTPAAPPRVAVGVSLVSGLLDLDIDIDGLDLSELDGILTGYRDNRRFHRLKDGRFIQLDDSTLEGLAELADGLSLTEQELRTGHISLPKYRAMYLDRILRDQESIRARRDDTFRHLVKNMKNVADSEFPVPATLSETLRNYQRTGFRWLKTLEELGFGGILADDMGLGKTLQMIALFLDAKEHAPASGNTPSLVVCPTSLVLNWEREIARFAPALTVRTVIGDAEERRQRLENLTGCDVLVTSYDLLKRDVEQYAPIAFRYQVLDEAQYIKNSTTQNAKAVKAIHAVRRYALTGTPVENRLSELWSIFDFLMPGFLYSYSKFKARFELPIVRNEDTRALERLNKMVSPFILRRLKRDVLRELPPKTERVMPATMDDAQRQVYLSNLAQIKQQLTRVMHSGQSGKGKFTILALLTRLRQICCDPRLCCEGYTGGSGKLDACMELLREATGAGHKVLLFSQFTSMLALLKEQLAQEDIGCYLLQGSTSKEERSALVDAFNADDTPVFLISLKAGGTGLNLTGADVVIHYDPWWNLSAQNQATDRAYRIGQKNPVQVIKLIARDSIEEKIVQLQESKWQLAESVVGDGESLLSSLTPEQLMEILD